MTEAPTNAAWTRSYMIWAAICMACALALTIVRGGASLPVIGVLPIWPITLGAALLGLPLLSMLVTRDVCGTETPPHGWLGLAGLILLGCALALPPIAIDLTLGFPRDINAPLPAALLFYPAVGLVAEVALHLLPMAVLAALLPRHVPTLWIVAPVVLAEPAFQALSLPDWGVTAVLVFGNVALVSGTQLYLFQRFGFGAMLGLRLSFYLFWHVIWGSARLSLFI